MPAFLASSSNVRLDRDANGGCVLIASCTRFDQTSSESRLDLDQFIANLDGKFATGPGMGGFSASSKNVHLEEDRLVCALQRIDQTFTEPTTFDLNEEISNHDGQLVWTRKCLITVDVGPHSGPCPKVVTLPSAGLHVSSMPADPQHANWTDKFRIEVEGNLLKVFRVDAPNSRGWAQHLVLGAMITVDVGPHSGPCPKVVTLPSAGLQVSSTPVGPQHADWNDKFRVEVEGNLLKVFRVDDGRPANAGWAQELVLGAMITVDVGPHSGPCPKVITLPSAGLQVSSTPFNPQQQLVQGSGANATTYYADNWTDIDTFRVEVEGNLLKVFRVDRPNAGWSQRLVLSAM